MPVFLSTKMVSARSLETRMAPFSVQSVASPREIASALLTTPCKDSVSNAALTNTCGGEELGAAAGAAAGVVAPGDCITVPFGPCSPPTIRPTKEYVARQQKSSQTTSQGSFRAYVGPCQKDVGGYADNPSPIPKPVAYQLDMLARMPSNVHPKLPSTRSQSGRSVCSNTRPLNHEAAETWMLPKTSSGGPATSTSCKAGQAMKCGSNSRFKLS
mmetsp:Transcript_108550/g.288920  ORF Transcript_108550/g.288920 Transcript_108550/m.288920 type:complete len:214 (+) Transcript_108550:458-1099(+)